MALTQIMLSGSVGMNISYNVEVNVGLGNLINLYGLKRESLNFPYAIKYAYDFSWDGEKITATLNQTTFNDMMNYLFNTENIVDDRRDYLFNEMFRYRYPTLPFYRADNTNKNLIKNSFISSININDLYNIFNDDYNINILFSYDGPALTQPQTINKENITINYVSSNSWIHIPLNIETADGYKSYAGNEELSVGNNYKYFHIRLYWNGPGLTNFLQHDSTITNGGWNTNNLDSTSNIYFFSNSIYISYYTRGIVSGGSSDGGDEIVLGKLNLDGSVAWLKQLGQFNSPASEQTQLNKPNIAVNLNYVYYTYITSGVISGGTNPRYGFADVVVAVLDHGGNYVSGFQSTLVNSASNELLPNICLDNFDNIIIGYISQGSVSGTNQGNYDYIVSKFNISGNRLWSIQTTDFNNSDMQTEPTMVVDTSNNIYVAFSSSGTINGLTAVGERDIFIAKISSSGSIVWRKFGENFCTASRDSKPMLAINNNYLYLVFITVGGTITGGTKTGSGSNSDLVLVKMDLNGNVIWSKQDSDLSTSGSENDPAIYVHNNEIYLTFTTTSTIHGKSNEIVVKKLDTNGNLISTLQESSWAYQNIQNKPAITMDNSNNVYITFDSKQDSNQNHDIIFSKITQFLGASYS